MHPVQEHTNTLGIDYSIQRLTEYIHIYMNMKGTVFQPRVLHLNLDNINHAEGRGFDSRAGKFPNFFCWGVCCAGDD